MDHPSSINLNPKSEGAHQPIIFREELSRTAEKASYIASGCPSGLSYHYVNETLHVTEQTTFKVPQLAKKESEGFKHSDFSKVGLQGPPTGVRLIEWSFDSQFMATKVESMPNAVWVWDMTTLQLTALLVHLNPVLSFKFAPQ